MRVDKAKNIAKVAKVALLEPLLTRDQIAEKAGVSTGTASNMLKELDATGHKDERIVGLTDGDFDMMKKIQAEKFARLENPTDINHNDLDKWENTATKRYSLFRGSATDSEGGLKENNVKKLSDDELLRIVG